MYLHHALEVTYNSLWAVQNRNNLLNVEFKTHNLQGLTKDQEDKDSQGH